MPNVPQILKDVLDNRYEQQSLVLSELWRTMETIKEQENEIRKLGLKRDALIIKAFSYDIPKLQISHVSGLSWNTVDKIIKKHVYARLQKDSLDSVALQYEDYEVHNHLTDEQRKEAEEALAAYKTAIENAS